MKKHTRSFKLKVVEKALHRPTHETLAQCAVQQGVGYSTLTRWMTQVKQGELSAVAAVAEEKRPQEWNSAQKLQAVIESAALTEEDQGRYCRRQGIFQPQLTQWKQEFMRPSKETDQVLKTENRALKEELKQVRRELARKEKALAEAAALLVLKKKPRRSSVRTRTIDLLGTTPSDQGMDRGGACRRSPPGDGVSGAGYFPADDSTLGNRRCTGGWTRRCVPRPAQ